MGVAAPRRGHDAPRGTLVEPSAGEKLTGILRSKPFTIPEKLSFLIAGHYGTPPAPEKSKNFVRLKLVEGDETIAEAIPPRNDTPHVVKWDLAKWKGKQGYIEAIDGDDRSAYAWIAFGQFKPEVAPTPGGMEQARIDSSPRRSSRAC